MANKNRTLGHDAERYYRLAFRELGFKFCETSRFASRMYDNAKIDLVNLPFNLQIKAGVQKNMNPGKELLSMEACIKNFFPPEDEVHEKPKILVHKKRVGPGNKRTAESEIVYMSRQQLDMYEFVICEEVEIIADKIFKHGGDSEFRHIVGITFEDFKNKIIVKIYKECYT